MKLLLDTHVWLWWLTEPEKLTAEATAMMQDGSNELLLSVASSWEIAIKYGRGKLNLPESPEDFVPKRLQRDGIATLHIEHRHALHVATLPQHHRDPFDRMLVAQAKLESLSLVTADTKFTPYEIDIVW